MSSIHDTYKKEIANWLQVESNQIDLFWKGRVGLYTILKAMGVGEGDEVIIPAFTCVVVPNAIIYLGAKPVYVDINADTLNTDLSKIKEKVTTKTKVIICQNTFGLSSDVDKIFQFAKENNIYSVEDCTHGFGGEYKGKPNGIWCDAAFYSTQWNKPFSTGVGGFTLVNAVNLNEKMKLVMEDAISPSFKDEFVLRYLIFIKKNLLRDWNYWFLIKLYRFLSKNNLVLGSSSGKEITSVEMPKGFFKNGGKAQSRSGVKQLKQLSETLTIRKSNALKISEFLKSNNKEYVNEALIENHSFLKYPIFVNDRSVFFELAQKNRIKLGDWFVSNIHPIETNFELWEIDPNDFPIATEKSKYIVNINLEGNVDRGLSFLERNLKLIK